MRDLPLSEFARLADYLARETTPRENAEIEQWLSQSSDRATFIEYLTRSRAESLRASVTEEARVETMLEQMLKTMPQEMRAEPQSSVFVAQARPAAELGNAFSQSSESWFSARLSLPRFMPQRLWQSMAGLGLGCLLLVSGWYLGTRSVPASSSAQYFSYITAKGERASVVLPDGSVVVLNVASQLSVPLDYERGNRALRLTGEALFSVTHNTESAFTVTTQQSTTRVLGTSFIVRQYPTDTVATVAVRDGKVSVGSAVLTAGSETFVSADGTAHTQAMMEERFDFAQGMLYISSRPLTEAIPELNRWYNVEIRLGDSRLTEQRMVGFFEVGSITDLMGILERSYGVRVVREGRVLTLYPQG